MLHYFDTVFDPYMIKKMMKNRILIIINDYLEQASHKILRCNIVQSIHPFSCGDTLSGNTHYFYMLTSRVFFLIANEADMFFLHFQILNTLPIFLFTSSCTSRSLEYVQLFSENQL